ncbi:MAG TPA: NAD-dependent epimerase/dehydratase family protein [Croceibacterium sp.]|nr:NAD-dependent epimerase/dehydratase family protein [Croceibacterium sp.]
MTVAITGATGFVGQAFLDAAEAAGIEVRALTRRGMRQRRGVEWQRGDLHNRATLAQLVDRAEAVVHIAGVVNTPDPSGFHLGNVEGTFALVEAAVAAGVPRIVFVSSLAAREPQLSTYGASKRKAEQVIAASGLDWTIVRPPAIYGPRDREILELFRLAARWGVVPMPPKGRSSLIHVDDLARLLLTLVPGGEAVTHRTFEPDDGRPNGWSHRELAQAIGRAVGRQVWVPHLSEPLLRAVAAIDAALRGNKAKLTPDRIGYMVHRDWVVQRGADVPKSLWRPEIPTAEGLQATARWYRTQGWLQA